MEEEADKYIRDIQKNEKDVKTAIVAANNHYAGFGPMTVTIKCRNDEFAKLYKGHFLLQTTKYLLVLAVIKKINKILKSINNYVLKQDRLIFLNSLNDNELNKLIVNDIFLNCICIFYLSSII